VKSISYWNFADLVLACPILVQGLLKYAESGSIFMVVWASGAFWMNMIWFVTRILHRVQKTIKSSTFSIGFRRISRLGSAFIFLWWFKLAHICIQVTSLHEWKKQGIDHKFLIGNRFHVTLRIVSPVICKQC